MTGTNGTCYRVRLTCTLSIMAWCSIASAQIFSIADGDVVTCGGAMVDSGGEGGPGYSDNDSYTATICPDQPGEAISLNTVIFDLSNAGTSPIDVLNVYDGPTTSDPLLGSYTSGDAPGVITASFGNPTGCLTIEFNSNETGTGAFAFALSCFVPCQPPTAVAVMAEPSPAHICQGEEVQFDASGSFAAVGQNVVQYTWLFGDGTADSTSGAIVSHVFPEPPGEHIIQLMIEDDNDCVNTNSVELQVLVSTTPLITGMDNETLCVGESVQLDADAQAVTWTGQPNVDFGEGILLPDELGVVFSSEISMNQFTPGQTMTSLGDILEVCFEMEHSYMGDFVLQLTSPTGETIIFHQQGGGATYLGEPVDDESQPNAIGTCYQYCFSPTATNGTWVDNANYAEIPLPPGDYESIQPFTNLLGSQLNGTWTISFTDLFGIDNGYICSWWIDFDPSLLPDVTVYTPVLDMTDPDSTNWSGSGLVVDPADPTQATFTPTTSGNEVFTFTVTDNFGCSYDTTLTVMVTPAAIVEATAIPPEECGDPYQLNAALQPPIPTGPVVYQWTPSTDLSNTTIPYPFATPAQDIWYTVTVFPAGHPLCGSTDSIFVQELTHLENDSLVTDAICHDDGTGSIQVITSGNGGPWNYTWTDAGDNIVQTTNSANGDTFFGTGGTYSVVITEDVNGNNCSDTLQATILEPSAVDMLSLSDDTTICRTGTATLIATAQGGTGSLIAHWNDAFTGWARSVSPLNATDYSVWATDSSGCLSDTLSVDVSVNPPIGLYTPDTIVTCPDLDTPLLPDTVFGGDGAYAYSWAGGPFQSEPEYVVNLTDSALIYITVTDGCETPDVTHAIHVSVKPIPDLVLEADTLLGCDPFAVIFSVRDTTEAATVDWDFGDGIVIPGPPESVGHTYPDPGIYDVSVTVHWPNGCDDDTTVTDMITVAAVPDAQFTWSPVPASTLDPTVEFVEQAGPYAVSWIWDFAGLDTAHGPEVEYTFPNVFGDLYPVQLVVANYLGCTDTVTRMIEVMDEFLVFIPTAFTPNNDGINELLFVQGDDIDTKDFLLAVFDRWGEKIFETTDRGEGWDGSFGGSPVQDGVYSWRLNARSFYTGRPHKLMGHVVVVR
jgi:gliding motility-associated-like protein